MAPPSDQSPHWAAGTRLGERYQVREFLGRGGMGEVYVAWDAALAKAVALKRLHRAADATALESLRREVVLAQAVTHENVCRTYDLEILDGDAVIKMEYVAGQTLAQQLDARPQLPLAEALTIARQLARGLAAAHAAGVVHRDLKPSNVIIDGQGRVRLMDFGIASAITSDDGAEASAGGTPSYMAPEQIRGGLVDGRADLYSLGCVLFRALAGVAPFSAATKGALLAQQLTTPAPALQTVRADAPRWLVQLVADLLAKEPAARPASAQRVVERLAGPPPAWRRWAPPLVAALVLVTCAGTIVSWRARVAASWRPTTRVLPGFEDVHGNFDIAPDGRTIVFSSHRDGSWRLYLAPVDGGAARPVTPAGFVGGGFTRDGKQLIVLGERERGIGLMPRDGGDIVWLSKVANDVTDCGAHGLVMSEFGKRTQLPYTRFVSAGSDGQLHELHRFAQSPAGLGNLLCDAAGKRLLFQTLGKTAAEARLWLLALDDDVVTPVAGGEVARSAHFAPGDASLLVTEAVDGVSHIFETSFDGTRKRQLTFGGGESRARPTPDGRRLLVTEETRATRLFMRDPGDARPRQLTFGNEYPRRPFIAMPDGSGVLVDLWTEKGQGDRLVFVPRDGDATKRRVVIPRFSAVAPEVVDGQLYYVDQQRLWRVALTNGVPVDLLPMTGGVHVSEDGWVHYTEKGDGGVTRALRRPLDGGDSEVEAAAPWQSVSPAPHSGWRVAWYPQTPAYGLFAPGASLDGPPTRTMPNVHFNWAPDGRSILWIDVGRGEIRRRRLDGSDVLVVSAPQATAVAEASDGTLFWIEQTEQRRVVEMTNFASRPAL